MKYVAFRVAFLVLLACPIAQAQARKGPPDHGPVLATAMEVAPHKLKDTTDIADTRNYVFRGKAITLDSDRTVHVVFDTDHMRLAGAWVGKYPAYSAFKNMGPVLEGKMIFATQPGPGWAKEKSFKDTRPHPEGPLPRSHAHYKGLYLTDRGLVVLAYSVGDARVLEMPSCLKNGASVAIERTIRVEPTRSAHSLLVCEEAGGKSLHARSGVDTREQARLKVGKETIVAGVVNAPAKAAWEVADGRMVLHLPPLPEGALFRIVVARLSGEAEKAGLAGFLENELVEDPAFWLKKRKPAWPETFITRGIPGDTGAEPYVVDQIMMPEDNPYRASIRVSGLDFFNDGRCAICTWDGDVWIVSGLDAKLERVAWKRFAAGLQQPLGLKIIGGVIHTAGRDQITRLVDLNDDGEADFYENFNNDAALTLQRHEFVMDLQTDTAGNLYYCRSGHYITSPSGANCSIYKLPPDGSKLERIAHGFREPNGLGVGPDGTLTVGDNEGNGVPQTPLYHLSPGRFYGYTPQPKPGAVGGSWKYTEKPIVWMPKGVDRSAGGQVWVVDHRFGPLKGQLLHTSYGNCLLYNVLIDKKSEPWQGAVWRFPVNFYSGIMRARFNPADGQLYVCGLRGWDTTSTKDGQFARVRYTGKKTPIPIGIEITGAGIDLVFSDLLKKESTEDDENWAGRWSEPILKTAKGKAEEEMPIKSIRLSPDGKKVSINLDRVQPVSNFTLQYRIHAADGARVAGQVDGTIHRVPGGG